MRKIITFLVITVFLLSGCSSASRISLNSNSKDASNATESLLQAVDTTASTDAQPESGQALQASATLTPAPSDTVSPTNTPQPSDTPTATVPTGPVFDPNKIVDITSLDNYRLHDRYVSKSTKADNTVEPYYSDLTVEYQKDPQIYVSTHLFGKELTSSGDVVSNYIDTYYWIGNFQYDLSEGGWNVRVISAKVNQAYVDKGRATTGFGNVLNRLQNLPYVGQEVINGIPVYHFSFNETNFVPNPEYDSTIKNKQVEGNVYIAQDGNYPVRYDNKGWAEVNPESPDARTIWGDNIRNETEEVIELVSVNQDQGVILPPDAPKTDRVVEVPLPPDAELVQIGGNAGSETYTYTTSKSVLETMDYYRSLTPVDGWQVEQVISRPDIPNFAQVNLNNGKKFKFITIRYNQYSGWTEIEVDFFTD